MVVATDFCINDWYYNNLGHARQLCPSEYENGQLWFACCEYMQLTEDMLMANDFVCEDKGTKGKRYVRGGNEFFVEVYFFDGMCNCFNARRSYFLGDEYVMDMAHKCGWCVHELQQTLRLVGLREMADNFKIEQE